MKIRLTILKDGTREIWAAPTRPGEKFTHAFRAHGHESVRKLVQDAMDECIVAEQLPFPGEL